MGKANILFIREKNGVPFPYTSKSTGLLSSSGVVKASFGILIDVLVYTDGANNATVTIYNDPDSADGKELAKVVVKGSDLMGGEVSILTEAALGMYISISGTGAQALVRYA